MDGKTLLWFFVGLILLSLALGFGGTLTIGKLLYGDECLVQCTRDGQDTGTWTLRVTQEDPFTPFCHCEKYLPFKAKP